MPWAPPEGGGVHYIGPPEEGRTYMADCGDRELHAVGTGDADQAAISSGRVRLVVLCLSVVP
eukprot:64625-Heterocapsa_arctica.AAC.1